jgi:hypothetical protein
MALFWEFGRDSPFHCLLTWEMGSEKCGSPFYEDQDIGVRS